MGRSNISAGGLEFFFFFFEKNANAKELLSFIAYEEELRVIGTVAAHLQENTCLWKKVEMHQEKTKQI
jgi:hypothetical protein